MSKATIITSHTPAGRTIDFDALAAFESGLNLRHLERSAVTAQILDYGEISTVFAIPSPGLEGLAFKRLPIFNTSDEMTAYVEIHERYNQLLNDDIDVSMVPHGYAALEKDRQPVFYIIQQQMPAAAIVHHALRVLPHDGQCRLFESVLGELHKIWAFNHDQGAVQVGVDGQLSNWVVAHPDAANLDVEHPMIGDSAALMYLDTSTPLFRVDGVEQLDPEMFLRSAPSFLRWILRWLFVEDVVNRYYDFRLVVVDAIANLYKEQMPQLVPDFIAIANRFFAGDASDLNIAPISEKQVRSYYREDAFIWMLYLNMRRLDRFLTNRILRRQYRYILPGRIKR